MAEDHTVYTTKVRMFVHPHEYVFVGPTGPTYVSVCECVHLAARRGVRPASQGWNAWG